MRISALIAMMILVTVVTVVVIGLAMFGQMRVQNMPMLEPLTPAKDSTTALDVIIPKSKLVTSNDLVERPMFWKERRPYVPPVKVKDKKIIVEEDPGPDPFEKITLMGIYSGGVMLKVDGTTQRIRVGETLEGLDWSLDSTSNKNQVLFIRGNETKILELEHAKVKAPKKTRKMPDRKIRGNKKDKFNAKKEESAGKNKRAPAEKKQREMKNKAELGKGLK